MKALRQGRQGRAWVLAALVAGGTLASRAADLPDLLVREAGYLVDCSFTLHARNRAAVHSSDAAYGALNVNRIAGAGPDWVRPGEAAMASIGLMAAARHLGHAGADTAAYDAVLEAFFRTWIASRQQPVNTFAGNPDQGGFYQRVYYSSSGAWTSNDTVLSSTTGQIVSAMWQYHEYLRARGRPGKAQEWLQQGWPIAREAGQYLRRRLLAPWNLVGGNASGGHLWISDSVFAAVGLRCLVAWSAALGQVPDFDYGALADQITAGVRGLADTHAGWGFFRYRDASAGYLPSHGECVDQLCFLPYEAAVLDPTEDGIRQLSDAWTLGAGGVSMTPFAAAAGDWRYFGTRWHYYFDGRPENSRLYPGPGLQLAKVEGRYGLQRADAAVLARAQRRLDWAVDRDYSGLWMGATGASEAGVPNGVIDWRNALQPAELAPAWARFCDTSAYLIEVALLLEAGVDTSYVPTLSLQADREGNQVRLRWEGAGLIQHAPSVSGPWLDLTNAASPLIVLPAATSQFYRRKP